MTGVCCIEQANGHPVAQCASTCPNQSQLCDPSAADAGCPNGGRCVTGAVGDLGLPPTYGLCLAPGG